MQAIFKGNSNKKKCAKNICFGTLKNAFFYQKRDLIFYLNAKFHQPKEIKHQCKMGFVSVLNAKNELDDNIASNILKELELDVPFIWN